MLDYTAQDSEHAADEQAPPSGYRLTHNAMATMWELYCFDEEEGDCEHAAELAFEEIDEIERQLSYFLDSSDINQINEAPAHEPVLVSVDTLECLRIVQRMHALTGGAFDPTVGALLTGREPWHLSEVAPPEGVPPESPQPERLGFETLMLDPDRRTVTRRSQAVQLDLGAIGKGYGVDRAMGVLDDWLEGEFMLVAGQSTMRGRRRSADSARWAMAICDPRDQSIQLDRIAVADQAVSAAAAGPSGHVLDPRTAQSARAAVGAWVLAESGAMSDALATGALVMSRAQLTDCCQQQPGLAIARLEADGTWSTYGQWDAVREGE